ncbi:IS630 family transposase [Mucilaginibacter sp. NFX135]|uniref:IS630 family transposase n=1 Tax=Mucilaginibacter sp. NFX135 TaxID=3402687 RepID=UPI003AFAD615
MEKNYPSKIGVPDFYPKLSQAKRQPSKRYFDLIDILPQLVAANPYPKIENQPMWEAYHAIRPEGYAFQGFMTNFLKWRRDNNICLHAHKGVRVVSPEDADILQEWRNSNEREKWAKAVIIQGSYEGLNLKQLSEKVEVGLKCVLTWIDKFKKDGTTGLIRKACTSEPWVEQMKEKQNNLMKLLHETPALHGFYRTSWSLRDLSIAYLRQYGKPMTMSTVSIYIHKNGFQFKKARVALTSPDPKFREKLDHIKKILSHLGKRERFFSIDEMGPLSIKLKGGTALINKDEIKIIPEFQKSRGFLILTAALELSSNQVTHFYSPRKDSAEMIKLIYMLMQQYTNCDKLYLSWDAASWHSSKQLRVELKIINAKSYRLMHHTPLIEIAPLPITAQFLNVIESVFSGLAKSVLHNSDYPNTEACKKAIDLYFQDRNIYFQEHPKRAGNKIWGKEVVKPTFDEVQNCKHPRAR